MRQRQVTTIERFLGGSHQSTTTTEGYVYCLKPSAVPDLTRAAKATLRLLARVLKTLCSNEDSVLWYIEGDMDPGNLPDLISAYFRDEKWDYTSQYWMAEVRKLDPEASVDQGLLCCVGDAGLGERLLATPTGVWWGGANQRIAGYQVMDSDVSHVIGCRPFVHGSLPASAQLIKSAFVLDHDLLFFNLFVPTNSDIGDRLETVFSSEIDQSDSAPGVP